MKRYKITFDVDNNRNYQEITFDAKNETEVKWLFAEYLETVYLADFSVYDLHCFVNRKKDKVFNSYYNSFISTDGKNKCVNYYISLSFE